MYQNLLQFGCLRHKESVHRLLTRNTTEGAASFVVLSRQDQAPSTIYNFLPILRCRQISYWTHVYARNVLLRSSRSLIPPNQSLLKSRNKKPFHYFSKSILFTDTEICQDGIISDKNVSDNILP